tara:strand:+ start:783 stop:1193 length:411 start_codon:yes stop_codon:yes gene_type:complete
MLSSGQRDLVRDKGTILGRALIGLMFVVSGIGMLTNPGMSADYFMAVGIPFAGLVVWLVIALKIVAGGAIVIGKRVGAAAAGLIVFTALATLLGHLNPFDMNGVLKNLAVIGGLLYLMAYGPGGTNTHKLADVSAE